MKHPLWLAIWIVAIEAIVILALVPGDWIEKTIHDESKLIATSFGIEERRSIYDRANSWFHTTLMQSGVYQATLDHLIPTESQIQRSKGLESLGLAWFQWARGRIEAIAKFYYQILLRFSLLLIWFPFLLILLLPAVYDGFMTWRIKRTNFAYASPLLHQYSTMGILYICFGLLAVFLAPFVIDPRIFLIAMMVICVLSGLMVGNFQKRM